MPPATVQCDGRFTARTCSKAKAKHTVLFDALVITCSNIRVQYLVYVHNLNSGSAHTDVLCGDAPAAPENEELQSYVRLWIDSMESNPDAAMRKTINEALEWPREHGEKVLHMTATTSLEMELGPNFDEAAGVIAHLSKLMGQLDDARLAKSA
jgi:hypothetical protein